MKYVVDNLYIDMRINVVTYDDSGGNNLIPPNTYSVNFILYIHTVIGVLGRFSRNVRGLITI